jgi:predicted type IV restriction endonuclease
LLIEVKAIGLDLKDAFVKQAIDYAANQGMDWVVLTNGIIWRIYRVTFAKPIDHELVVEFNICDFNPKNQDHLAIAFMMAKEGWQRSSLGEYHLQRQALNRYTIAALLLSDSVADLIRRELRYISPGVKIDSSEIKQVLEQEVLKREVVEGEKAELAKKQVSKVSKAKKVPRTPKEPNETVEEAQVPQPSDENVPES